MEQCVRVQAESLDVFSGVIQNESGSFKYFEKSIPSARKRSSPSQNS